MPVEEQQNSRKKKSSAAAVVTDTLAPPPVALTDEERSQYEALITSLYQQLDDKVSPGLGTKANHMMLLWLNSVCQNVRTKGRTQAHFF